MRSMDRPVRVRGRLAGRETRDGRRETGETKARGKARAGQGPPHAPCAEISGRAKPILCAVTSPPAGAPASLVSRLSSLAPARYHAPMQPHHHHDILIIGGGLVGASLAIALDGAGLNVGLVEAAPPRVDRQPSHDERN